jgi:hypothetical protein
LGSLKLAGQILEEYPNCKRNLFIFSDMIEQTNWYDFAKIELNDENIKEIIENEKKLGRLPSLDSVSLYIVGAGNSKLKISELQKERIEKFWRNYFKETGGILVQYSGPLIRIPKAK